MVLIQIESYICLQAFLQSIVIDILTKSNSFHLTIFFYQKHHFFSAYSGMKASLSTLIQAVYLREKVFLGFI